MNFDAMCCIGSFATERSVGNGLKADVTGKVETVNRLHALDPEGDRPRHGMPRHQSKQQLLEAMKGHILGETQLVGVYKR